MDSTPSLRRPVDRPSVETAGHDQRRTGALARGLVLSVCLDLGLDPVVDPAKVLVLALVRYLAPGLFSQLVP